MDISNLSLSLGEQTIFKKESVTIGNKDKVGVVGVNGAGKTTLFNVLLGKITPDSGEIRFEKKSRIGYLPQVINITDDTLTFDYIYSGRPIIELQKQQRQLEKQMANCQDDKQIKKIFSQYDENIKLLDYWEEYSADSILDKILKGMNISSDILNIPVNKLSGGEKSKIAFAKILFEKPNVLLLDEPTNHLDAESRDWVIDYLKNYNGMVLIISHDIKFLDSIINKTLFLDKQTHSLKLYSGNYSKFLKLYEEYKLTINRQVEAQTIKENKLKQIIQTAEGGSVKRKRVAKSREKELKKLQENKIEKIENSKKANIKIKAFEESEKIPIRVKNLTFGYNKNKILINNLSFMLNSKDRFLIAGHNGVGKSTLLKLIIGELKPIEGEIKIGTKTKIAYYDQEQKNLFTNETILEHFEAQGISQKSLRAMLSKFLFYDKDIHKKLNVLSPGERCRIAFAELALKKSNLIILDEPTNHLDPITQKIIATNFKEYDGTILLVSHNPDFVEDLGIDKVLLLPSEKIVDYDRQTINKIKIANEQNS